MPGALLIDFDGVLRVWDQGRLEAIEEQAGLPAGAIRRVAFAPDLVRQALIGQISDETWRDEVAARLHADFPHARAALAVSLWSESSGAIDASVLSLVNTCRAKAKIVLVTNATTRLSRDLCHLGLGDTFDHIINSSEIGHAKPEREVFEIALATAGVASHGALFVDDDAQNVGAAIGIGIGGHLYRGVEGLRDVLTRRSLID